MQEQQSGIAAYDIDIQGISLGEHHFDIEVGDDLFALYEGCEVLGGNLKCHIDMERGDTMLRLYVDIEGVVSVECDRCLEPCDVEVSYNAPLIVRLSDDELTQEEMGDEQGDGEVIWIARRATTIPLTHYIYESVILSLPFQRVHDDGGCSAEMMKHFRIVSNEEFEQIEAASEAAIEAEDNEGLSEDALAKLQALKEQMMK